ncbi:MAG: hypothetical protein JNM88_07640 [Chitinophagaceae bacterium]|nr:hypothetical protein [Chitinophagaceae bacterium]
MKKLLPVLVIAASTLNVQAQVQKDTLPPMKLPAIPCQPKQTKGWSGQFVYEIHFDGESSGMLGKFKQYYKVKADCIHSGYIEFPTEVRGAIRVNQPDKNNTARWESWIRSGTTFTCSNVDVTISSAEQTSRMGSDAITGTVEKKATWSTNGGWAKGWLSNTDLQIDHTTGTYTFAVPFLDYEQSGGKQQFITTTFNPAKKDSVVKDLDNRHGMNDLFYVQYGEWDMVTGSFQEGQKEITIRKRIPMQLQQTIRRGTKDIKLSAAKGYMDFYLVLRRIG